MHTHQSAPALASGLGRGPVSAKQSGLRTDELALVADLLRKEEITLRNSGLATGCIFGWGFREARKPRLSSRVCQTRKDAMQTAQAECDTHMIKGSNVEDSSSLIIFC